MSAAAAAAAPNAANETRLPRGEDRFIPIAVPDLLHALEAELSLEGGLARVTRELSSVIEQEAAALRRELETRYAPFNPDRDTLVLPQDPAQRDHGAAGLDRMLCYLLDKANFRILEPVEIQEAVRVASAHGVRVRLDPQRIARLSLFVRGHGVVSQNAKTWRHPLRGENFDVPVHRRLVVIARLREDPHLLLKVFKDIPAHDVETLLPHAEVTMSWRDQLLMVGGGAGALGSTAAQVLKILSAGLLAVSRLLWIVLVGTVVLIWRTVTGYRRARRNSDSLRTRHLYYQNVANNFGALATLVAMIAQEEQKECLLAYALCAARAGPPRDLAELRERISRFLGTRFGTTVDFDLSDALEELDRHGLWAERDALRVLPPDEAAARLRAAWMQRRSESYHLERCNAES